MARKLVSLEEAAVMLGITPDALNEMRQRQEIYGYRDGPNWKFKPEDVEKILEDRNSKAEGHEPLELDSDSGDDMIMVSEMELGEVGPTPGGSTVIGRSGEMASAEDSDVKLAKKIEDELKASGGMGLADSSELLPVDLDDSTEIPLAVSSGSSNVIGKGDKESKGKGSSSKGSDLQLAADSSTKPSATSAPLSNASAGGSDIQLGVEPDDELVLGGSGSGSDITISPGDSGISLVDPADSGLSLEEPLELGSIEDSSFDTSASSAEIGVEGSSEFDSDAVMELKTDDEFLLTPSEESSDSMTEDSGSQVIALDADSEFEDASSPTMLSAQADAAMLEEETPSEDMPAMDAGMFPDASYATAAGTAMYAIGPASQFSVGSLIGLTIGVLLLSVTGLIMFDVVRNMWSWDSGNPISSPIINGILGIFGK